MKELHESEINRIIEDNAALSNEELVRKYFDILYNDVLGSQADLMEEAGWEEVDVLERRKHEHFMRRYARVLERMLNERGVDPWEECAKEEEDDLVLIRW